MVGCGPDRPRDHGPDELGPDVDFGNSPIRRTLPDRRSIMVIGRKSGVAWASTPTSAGRSGANGMMRAYPTSDGRVIWEFNTARDFETANGVPGKGGAMNGPGPVVAGGMMFTNSGYSNPGQGASGNVLLAFAVQ